MTRILLLVAGAVVIFVGGLVGTLGMRGQLDSEHVSKLLGEAPLPEEGAPSLDDLHADLTAGDGAEAGDGAPPIAGSDDLAPRIESRERARSKTRHEGARPDLLPRILLPSPFSAAETESLLAELERHHAEVVSLRAQLDREHRDLDLIRADLDRRCDELDRREQELEEWARGLEAERVELTGRVTMVEEAELANMKQLADDIAKMRPTSAAQMLLEKDPAEVAKILAFIKPRESARIMDNLPSDFASKVAERRLGMLRPDATTGATGGP